MYSKRQSARVAVNRKAHLSLLHGSGEAEKCTLLDVSAEGVAVKVSSPEIAPEPGDWLTIYMDTGGAWVDIAGRVRYAVNINLETVLIGIELDLAGSGASTNKTWSFWVQNLVASVPASTRL